jgi:hypothetical protein
MKYKSLIIFLYFDYTLKNQVQKSGDFYCFLFLSFLAIEKLPKNKIANFKFSLTKRNGVGEPLYQVIIPYQNLTEIPGNLFLSTT